LTQAASGAWEHAPQVLVFKQAFVTVPHISGLLVVQTTKSQLHVVPPQVSSVPQAHASVLLHEFDLVTAHSLLQALGSTAAHWQTPPTQA
jgi:hypothetical protein